MNRATNPYAGYRYPAEILSHAVWLYFRFTLSFRDIEEIRAARGIFVTDETIRQWCLKFGQPFANAVRRRLPRPGDKWPLDERYLKLNGQLPYLWRAALSHQPTRPQERQMRRFQSAGQAQRFLSAPFPINNLFRFRRPLPTAADARMVRAQAFDTWQQVTCVPTAAYPPPTPRITAELRLQFNKLTVPIRVIAFGSTLAQGDQA